MILRALEVTVRYPRSGADALSAVSFGVGANQLVAVVGPNGSGKTTLVRALAGLLRIERGSVTVHGRPVHSWPRRALARTLAVVPQREETLFPLRVEETVMFGRYARLDPLAPPSPADREAVRAALQRCDVADLAHRPVDTLSGGEWQRVRIARGLAQEPRVLVLDEPTASLDVRHEMELFELVRRLVDDGLASLVITHHLNLAARFADRVVLLDQGRIVAQGTPRDVFTDQAISGVFQWPVAVTTWCDGSPQVVPLRTGEVRG